MTFRIVSVLIHLVALIPCGIIAGYLRRASRAGRQDRAGEWWVRVFVVYTIAQAVRAAVWPSAPTWLWMTPMVLMLAGSFGFLAVRIRHHPDAMFDPGTVRRLRDRGWIP